MNWFKENIWHLVSLAISVVAIYVALNDRITVTEQKIYNLERSQERIEQTTQTSLSEIKNDVKEVNQKMDDLTKYLLPR